MIWFGTVALWSLHRQNSINRSLIRSKPLEMTIQLPNNPHHHATQYTHLLPILMKDHLRISHFGVGIATIDEQGLRTWLRDLNGEGEGEGSGRIRLRCGDAAHGAATDGEDITDHIHVFAQGDNGNRKWERK